MRWVNDKRAGALLGIALLIVPLSACGGSDDPTASEQDPAVTGLAVSDGSGVIAAVQDGEVVGELVVSEGLTTGTLTVQFVDEFGDNHTPTADETMTFSVGSIAMAEFTLTAPGAFSGTLSGIQPGSTTISFQLVGAGTSVYNSPPIPVSVRGPEL